METLLKVVADLVVIQFVNPTVLIISCYLMLKASFLKVKGTLYILIGVTSLHHSSLPSWMGIKMPKNQGTQPHLAFQKIEHIREETGHGQILMVSDQVQQI